MARLKIPLVLTRTSLVQGIGDNGPSVEQILSRGVGNHGDPKEDGEVDGEESFEELFGRFAEMKGL